MPQSDIIWYNSVALSTKMAFNADIDYSSLPGYYNLTQTHEFFATNISLTDRYGGMRMPVKTKVLDSCVPPAFVDMDVDYETICLERAQWLMAHAKATNRKIFLMYSGGIDSSTIVCSFLMSCSLEDIKTHIVLALSEDSIRENPTLYSRYVRPHFNKVSSYTFQTYLGNDKYITVSGEGNDQLFGSAVMKKLLPMGDDIITRRCDSDTIYQCFNSVLDQPAVSKKFVEVFNQCSDTAPMPINSVFHYFWWINMRLKWQSVYVRVLSYTKGDNGNTLRPEDNYFSFFQTDKFQLWAMNNSDKLVRKEWLSYKYVCKELIFKLNKDENYRDKKAKIGSLINILNYRKMGTSVDTNFNVVHEPIDVSLWDHNNDFV